MVWSAFVCFIMAKNETSFDEEFAEQSDLLLSQMYLPETEEISSPSDLDDREDFALSKKQKQNRFNSPVKEADIIKLQKDRIPLNTRKNTNWCTKIYDAWGVSRNTHIQEHGTNSSEKYVLVPPLTADIPVDVFDFWMCRFVCEIKRQDGSNYPASSLKNICIGIWRFVRDEYNRHDLNFMDSKNGNLSAFRATLDGQMKKLNNLGVGLNKKQAQPLSVSHEQQLWDSGVFGQDNAKQLFNAIYFYNSKVFGLRACDEHNRLLIEQFEFGKDYVGEYVEFIGKNCKNYQGGLKQSGKISFRKVKHYAQNDNERCYVKLLRLYLDSLPEQTGAFYRRPLVRKKGGIAFSKQKVGIHTIEQLMKTMCKQAGLEDNFTGHSSKVTTATTLFNNKVDEQLVMERTGHRSTAVRAYKRTHPQLNKEISDMLQPPAPKKDVAEKASKISETTVKTSEIERVLPSDEKSESPQKITITYTNGSQKLEIKL